jgi:hypothetical protein
MSGIPASDGDFYISIHNGRYIISNSDTADDVFSTYTDYDSVPTGRMVLTVINRTASSGTYGKIYLNGVDVTKGSTPTNLTAGTVNSATTDICLGAGGVADLTNNLPGGNFGFTGQMFEVSVYNNEEHTPEQVLSNSTLLKTKWSVP